MMKSLIYVTNLGFQEDTNLGEHRVSAKRLHTKQPQHDHDLKLYMKVLGDCLTMI